MKDLLGTLQNIPDYVYIILLAIIFAIVGFSKAREGIKEYWLFRKLMRVDRQGVVVNFLNRLAKLPPETVPDIISEILLPTDDAMYLGQIVREHTQVLPAQVLVGIHDTPKGKVKTQYYVDVLSACCDAQTRRRLARMMAIRITERIRQERHLFEAIAVSARGNVLLAAEVGDLLDKPIVLFGDLAGVNFPERMQGMGSIPQRYIIVDGLSASGEETLYLANLIKSIGGEVRFVFMVIDRCFGAKDRVRNESPFPHPLELICLDEYDDKRCSQLLASDKNLQKA